MNDIKDIFSSQQPVSTTDSFNEFINLSVSKKEEFVKPKTYRTSEAQLKYVKEKEKTGKKQISAFISEKNLNNIDVMIAQYLELKKEYNRSEFLDMVLTHFFQKYPSAQGLEYDKKV